MNADVTRDLLCRQQELERRGARYRQGTVTTASPLAVALGGSSTSYSPVKRLGSYIPVVGDVVSVLVFGSDMLVLGAIDAGPSEEGAAQAGVLASTDCALTVNSITQVTIAAGRVYLTSAAGGLIRTAPVSTVLSGIVAASASNFRLDEVVVNSAGVVSILTGTQGTTVTLANRLNAVAVPAGSQLLHDMLVTSGGVLVANVRDRRPWARGGYARILRNANAAAGNDYTTTSSTLVDIDATNLAIRMECSGVPVRFSLHGRGANATANSFMGFAYSIDGALIDGVTSVQSMYGGHGSIAGGEIAIAFSWEYAPAAGSHLFKPQWLASAATTANLYVRATIPLIMKVEEITRPSANNGTS